MTRTPDRLPSDLLSRPRAERLAYFMDKTIAHPRLKEADEALMRAIRQPAGASLVLVFGPTGVGKTTLRRRVEKRLTEELLPDLTRDPGRIPVVAVEAVAPESGNFNWKDYFWRLLMALHEPLIDRKIDYRIPGIRTDVPGRLMIERAIAAPELRRALEQGLRHRRPAAVLIDEAQHFGKMTSGRRLLDQMDTIKSLASMTGIPHVLLGTYQLLDLTNLSAQLNRRCVEIHFPRYRVDRPGDIIAFKNILFTFQRYLPLPDETDLMPWWEFCYERSLGCVGILKTWLTRALAAALDDNQTTLTLAYLERHAESTRKLEHMTQELREGEEKLMTMRGASAKLRTLLDMDIESISVNVPASPSALQQHLPPVPSKKTRGRVGLRKPKRDAIGAISDPTQHANSV